MLSFDKDVLTTGEVAKICNVAPRTVSKWFDTGVLKGYRIPGSKDRRIPVSQLVRFMKEHGIPFDGMSGGKTRVLIVDDEQEIVDVLSKVLGEQASYEVRTATTGFAAGMEAERFKPHVMLLDIHLGDNGTANGTNDVKQITSFVRNDEDLQLCKIIAMSGKLTDGQITSMKSQGYDGFLKKPFAVRQVVEAIEAATSIVS
ncbi:MAG TPA: response regulator [Phycisphaerales bacterium]|jgi:excisionase family DNA binding protein|nr:response regulator [Phycisphaerales bacterium]